MDTTRRAPPVLRCQLLGDFGIGFDGPIEELTRPRSQSLLAYLLLHRAAPQSRRHLAFLLWPDSTEKQALTNLRHVLHDIQVALPPAASWLLVTSQTLQWNPECPYGLDVATFEQMARLDATPPALQAAIDLYQGDLLPACYDDWILPHRERLAQLYASALERLILIRETEADYAAAIQLAGRLLTHDPTRETTYRWLMRLHAARGDRGAACRVYQSCTEVLHRELGVEPSAPMRRQYEELARLDHDVTSQLPSFLQVPPGGSAAEADRPVFVTREAELARLDAELNKVLAGRPRVVFVTGDPGMGKTSLLQEFGRRALAVHQELIVTAGRGDAFTGAGDPYVPFREILGLLCGDVEDRLAANALSREAALRIWLSLPVTMKALVDVGADLVGIFVPGAPLFKRAAYHEWRSAADWLPRLERLVALKARADVRTDLKQNALFEQYARVIRTIANTRPLLLLVDDLQWADTGSIGLLSHLAQKLVNCRILIVAAYRANEVALGRDGQRHPLERVVNELKQQMGDIELDLHLAAGESFVAAFLDSEPNRLDEAFRRTLFAHTAGLPLATIELLREMQERGDLIRDGSGSWIEGASLDWDALPARVEAMITERVSRLPALQRRILEVASVEGEAFTAEVAARVVSADERATIELLSEVLGGVHHLVVAQGIERVDGKRLSVYRFQHILFQRYLYSRLDPVRRARLHADVAVALQGLYVGSTDDVAVRLARHFHEAGAALEAASYLVQAGDRAAQRAAYQEAVAHYDRAIEAYEAALGEKWEPMQRAILERKIGEAFYRCGEHEEALQHFETALVDLGRPLPTDRWEIRVATIREAGVQAFHRLCPRSSGSASPSPDPISVEAINTYLPMGWITVMLDVERFLLISLLGLNLSERSGYAHGIVSGAGAFGAILQLVPAFKLSRGYHERAVQMAEQGGNLGDLSFAYSTMAVLKLVLGELEDASAWTGKAVEASDRAGNVRDWAYAAHLRASTLGQLGRFAQAAEVAEEMYRRGHAVADRQIECWALSKRGFAELRLGRTKEAEASLSEAVELAESVVDRAQQIEAGTELARCYLRKGEPARALSLLQRCARINAEHTEGWGVREGLANALAATYIVLTEQSESPRDHLSWQAAAHAACRVARKQARGARHREAEALRLQGVYDWLTDRQRRALKWWRRSLAVASKVGQPYEEGLARLEMGLHVPDRAHLEAACVAFEAVGAAYDLARARQALTEPSTNPIAPVAAGDR